MWEETTNWAENILYCWKKLQIRLSIFYLVSKDLVSVEEKIRGNNLIRKKDNKTDKGEKNPDL